MPAPVVMRVALAACLCMIALTTVFAQTTLVSFPSDLRLEDPTSLDELQDIPVLGILDAGGDYTDVNFRIYAQNKDGSAQPFHQVLSCGNGATTNVYGDESYFLIPDEIDDGPPDCVLFGLNFDNDDAIDSEVYVQLDQPVTGLLMFIAPVGKYPFSMDDIVLSSDFEVLADGCTAADGTYAGTSCMPLTRAGPGQLHRAMSSRGVIRFLGPVSTLIAGHYSPCGAQFDFTLGLQKKIDCVQQPACEWSACDATCGSGSQNRTLYTVQAALNGGAPCLPPVQVQACPNLPECSSDCVVGDWGDFTACSASCGGGTRSQTRVIESPAVGAGAACPALTNTEQCNTFGCPVDCVLSGWSDWTVCSATCGGGMQTRNRSVVTDSANGGVDCGVLVDQRVCNSADCPVDCAQSDWGVFGECSATCGAGTQTATRVTLTFPENGGAQCGPETTTQACNNGPCPVDCQVSDWSDFGDCSATCGGGDKTRTRTITVQPANGGAECPALTDTDDCNYTPCPVDCVGSWSAWSSCSASCAGGVSTRTFQIVTPAANNGAACPDGVQQQPCNTQLCPVDCVMSDWSDFSQCSASCGGGTQTHTRTITTAPANGGAQCLPTQETVPCNTVACPVDCQMGPWSQWSSCPVQCGGGLSTRTRSVAVAPANGGAVCDVASQTQPCNTQVCDVNCVQTPWSSFSACDAPCGGGNQVRTRTTVTPAAGNGVACGPTVDTEKCNTQACAVDCQMSEYGPWSLCSSSCGGGLQTRVRSVLVPSASGGASCPCTTDTQQCNTAACPVDCVVSAWSDPSSCSASCGGGTATRTRVVIVQPANNGASCPPLQTVDQCNTQTCPTDCAMNPWSPWSDCSQTCGGGVQTCSRSVNVPAANGGLACPSDLTAQQACNTQGCPVDCVMSDWTTDGVCSAQCGTGVQTWTRTVLTAPQNGGQTCGPTSRSDPCNTQDCPTNCVVSEWSDFGTCSASCGGGVYTRTRSITAQPTNGGNKCPSDLSDTQPCNTQGCAVDCAVGDWGAWSTCSATCGSGTQQRTRAVVTAAANGGKACPCLTDFQTCNTQKCAIDCKMSDWHDWGSCSKKCGGGLILRTRSISQFPSCGGAKCGSLIEIDKCNTQPCDVDCQMGDWTAWGKCSATCGGGTQTRTRGVQRSQCGKGALCPTQTDTRSCNTDACPQDCAQGPWSDWGACSATCGGGSQTRTRVVTGQPKGCGKSCGSSSETRRCGTGACPKDCQMGDWTAWGKCSKECGGGVQIRSRSVKQQKCGKGAQCPNIYDQQACNTQACVQPKVDCQVSAWGAWSQCSASCGGGTKTHTRTVITPASNGGAVCPALSESALCNSDACPVDCAMNPFGPWSQCSKTCGGGVQTRTRSVQRAQCGKGASCPATSEQQACNTAPCDAECQVSDWSNWGSCSKSCGTGTQTRTRKITQAQCGKGKQCPALSDTQYCNTQACDADCTVSDFGPWSTCSKSCGGGTQTRSRKVVAEKCGKGASCPGLSETQKCNTQTCVTDCKVSDWGCWGSCSKSCGTGVQTRSRSVVQQPSTGGAACPALTDQQTCNTGACKQDCVVSAWSSFGTCSKSCGTGQQTRTRTVLTPAANGGAACPALTDSTCCNTQSCKQDCQVSDFGSWSQCSQSCGGGVQTRSRSVTVKAANGGASCPCLTDTQQCNTQSCSKDCQVSDWTQWTTCSKSCGGGWTYQYRTITQQPSCGGGKCPALLAYKACNTQACAVDCKLTDWSSWGQCSKTCGSGVQTRKRSIVTYSCGGGSSCPASTELQQSQACNTVPCASDCVVSPWGQWSQCSKSCGGGVTTQTRTVISPAVGCGSTCPALSQSNSCNTQPCKQDCQVSAWSPFGACSVGCGGGTQTRTRTVTLPALGGGAACPALTDSTTCNAQPCPAGGTCNYGVTAYTVSTAGVAVNFANGIDSIDVNIRISYNNGQLATLNFHPNTGCSKGSQMVFNHLTHPNFPKSCSGGAYSIVWVQVNGNNCHWGEQKEQPICGTVPQSCAWVYNAWGSCSNQCGSGTQSRTAVCQTASGASCDVSKCGPSVLTQSCSSNAACGVGCSATSCSGDGSSSTVSFAVGNAGVLAISLQFAQPTYGDLRGFFLDFPSSSRLSSQCAKCQLTGSSVTAFERNTKTMGCDSSVSLQGCSGPSSYDLVAAIGTNAVLKDDIRSTTVYLACSGLTLTLDDVKGASVGVRSIWVGNNALLRLQTTKQTCIVGNQ